MPWAVAAAGVAAAGAIGAGAMQSSATSKAADAAAAEQRAAREQMRADLQPWRETGQNALMVTSDLAGVNGADAAKAAMADFVQSPGYQYQLEQGLRAVNAGSAAQGMAASGANLKALQDRGNSLAAQDFATYYNRLAGLTTLGQQSAAAQASATGATASDIAQTQMSAGGAQASIYGNTAQGIGNAVNNGMNNYLYMQKTNSLYK